MDNAVSNEEVMNYELYGKMRSLDKFLCEFCDVSWTTDGKSSTRSGGAEGDYSRAYVVSDINIAYR